jgi:homoserine O-succinyltransferase
MQFRYQQQRQPQAIKTWGVFSHKVLQKQHPLVNDINSRFDVPHSRWNVISREQFEAAGLRVLVESEEAGVHLATSPDGLRFVLFQGHPEYDTVSLLKEYKREVMLFRQGKRKDYPPFPDNTFHQQEQAILREYQRRDPQQATASMMDFPEQLVASRLDNTWHDTAEAVVSNWMGCVYQVTHKERHLPFMDRVDPENPLKLS